MAKHLQKWIKVNAAVDLGIAEIVSLLSCVEQLETLQSCEGDPAGKEAYVYFCCGDWSRICARIFEKIGPALKGQVEDEDARLTVEVGSSEEPIAKLSFRAEVTGAITSALKKALGHEAPKV